MVSGHAIPEPQMLTLGPRETLAYLGIDRTGWLRIQLVLVWLSSIVVYFLWI